MPMGALLVTPSVTGPAGCGAIDLVAPRSELSSGTCGTRPPGHARFVFGDAAACRALI